MVARSQPRTAPQSPSSRRAWIEIQKVLKNTAMLSVALLAEGVDRNDQMQPLARWVMTSPSSRRAWIEMIWTCKLTLAKKSPSSRRAWIEMSDRSSFCSLASVALLAEGVDRNLGQSQQAQGMQRSPSSRRAWIEIVRDALIRCCWMSPSSRRAWIEMSPCW